MAARIDCFSRPGQSTNVYGQKLRSQLEERLDYWATGKVPRTNEEVIQEANAEIEIQRKFAPEEKKAESAPAATDSATKKKKKKKKKDKKAVVTEETSEASSSKAEKKKKKKKKKRTAEQAGLEEPT